LILEKSGVTLEVSQRLVGFDLQNLWNPLGHMIKLLRDIHKGRSVDAH
jgi:hypothetical protein